MNSRIKFNVLMLFLVVLISSCEEENIASKISVKNGDETAKIVNATHLNDDFIFTALKEKQTMHMEALLFGTLYIADKCFKIDDNVIIWPYNYSIQKKNGSFVIYDDNEEFVASEGDSLYLSGGQINEVSHLVSEELYKKLPSGPYWIVGESVENLTEENK